MSNLSEYSCDKCTREFSWHCKHCWHTINKKPTRFKPKKKTGCQTPELRKPTPPPPPPTSGSNTSKPNPNYIPPSSTTKSCLYETPCGWCTKWDKNCDKRIGREKSSELDDIRSGKGFSRLNVRIDSESSLPLGLRREFSND